MQRVRSAVTAVELLRSSAGRRAELEAGELVEMSPVGRRHSRAVVRLAGQLDLFVTAHGLGEVSTGLGFILARDPDTVRAPDVAFVSAARLHGTEVDGYFHGAPDLAIEVLSPDDRASDVMKKIREYLAAGTQLVVLVDPRSETLTVHLPGGDAHAYEGGQQVSLAPVLVGCSISAAELFRGN